MRLIGAIMVSLGLAFTLAVFIGDVNLFFPIIVALVGAFIYLEGVISPREAQFKQEKPASRDESSSAQSPKPIAHSP